MKHGMIKTLLVLAAAYMNTPIFSQDANTAVGTPNGIFEVSNMGAAQYHIQIEVPDGGPLMPDVSIDYNSQAGDGLVGYGFSIGGLQCITRGGKDLLRDKEKTGVKYDANDAFFLNGTRLILQSGTETYGADGSTYTPEGDPHTIVTLHNSAASTSSWFSVTGKDGKVYEFGYSTDSRYIFNDRKNVSHTAAWYVNKVSDSHTNYMTYHYTTSKCVIRPTRINYGMNRGITNSVIFNYSTLPAASITKFAIGDCQGILDVYLSSIVTQTGNSVYRTYNFTYNGTSDATALKHYRLTRVDMKNGSGEATSPIKIQWNHLLNPPLQSTELNVATKEIHNSAYIEKEDAKSFLAVDINGDGVSDIIRLAYIENKPLGRHVGSFYGAYISLSKVSSSGEVSFNTNPFLLHIDDADLTGIPQITNVGTNVLDINGDGLNDLVIPFHYYIEGDYNQMNCHVIFGADETSGDGLYCAGAFPVQLQTPSSPLYTAFDVNGDGKDELVFVERGKVGDSYPCVQVEVNKKSTNFTMNLPKVPQKLFSGDYNNDGLTDLIVLYDGGYKIFFNNGGKEAALKFTDSNSKSGETLKNCWRIQQGDFDGDGLIDFVYNVSRENFLWVARNNGDGTFNCTKSDGIGVIEGTFTDYDNDKFSLMVWDMDHDGRSDVMVCKADYEHISNWFEIESYGKYRNTQTKWLYSDGTTLKLKKSYTKKRKDDAIERYIFLGDFDGDGYLELANYGSKLNSTDDTFNEKINIYKSGSAMPHRGKVSKITDGLGNYHTIKYEYITNPLLYKNNRFSENAVNSYTLPIPVVFSVLSSRGAAGPTTTEYSYEDLLLHLKGKGNLGFQTVRKENSSLNTSETTRVKGWDRTRWVPKEIETIRTVGDDISKTIMKSAAENVGKNYFSYVYYKKITDMDDNMVSIESEYDIAKGVVTMERVMNLGEGMYKEVEYTGYNKIANKWLPSSMTTTQQHPDDNASHSSKTTYTYTPKGNVASITTNSGTPMALKTEYTYDKYGNVTSSVSSGQGVKAVKTVKTLNTYDATGRFITKTQTSPASAVKTYTYDIWGNMLTECDETDASNKLTTTYTYDGWGRLKTKTTPEGLCTNYETGWASGGNKKYYTKETGTAMPPVTIYYDAFGHELQRDTKGPKNIDITKTTSYNRMGLVSQVKNVTGTLLSITDKYTYDTRGRMLSETSSTGKSTTYSYNNRTVTTTTAGRTYTTTTDAWGNIIKSSDPQNEVEYQYFSNGKPSSVTTNGNTVSMTYDVAGNQTSLTDPDAGTSTYTYAADGILLTQTDGRGVETRFIYDDFGRIKSKQVGLSTINYTYGETGVEKLRLIKETLDDKTVEYTHDKYGRVLEEKRTVGEHGTYTFTHSYNDQNQLSQTIYPGGLTVTYQYDENGYKTQTQAGTAVVYQQTGFNGLVSSSSFMGKLTSTSTRNSRGYLQNMKITKRSSVLEQFNTQYEISTGNLLSRQRKGASKETFTYDNLDRLVSVKVGSKETMRMDYADNGNILYKTDIGEYEYNAYDHPHAVTDVEDVDMIFPESNLSTSFNDFGKIESIRDWKKNGRIPGRIYRPTTTYANIDFEYGPHQERWYSKLTKGALKQQYLTTIYAGDYEKITDYDEYGDAHIREFYYLDGNSIVIKENGEFKNFLAFTDNIGSILSVIDEEGSRVFDASYDAWGRQTVTKNEIGLRRGYTGHEMLNEVGIINMNGRLYDPLLGRFLSPDNYVQAPDNSQSFNRYSYCLNNPLKYNDPSGEFWNLVIGAAIGGVINWALNGGDFNAKGLGYFAVGALAGAVSTGVASGMNVAMAGGNFWAGAAGLAQGVSSTGFVAGAATGSSAGFAGGFVSGAGNSWVGGNSFGKGLFDGLKSGSFGALSSGVIGGLVGGFDALSKGTNFWTGKAKFDMVGAYSCSGCMPSDFELGESTITGKYVGQFEGVNVFESKTLGSLTDPNASRYSAVTIPERGIIAAEGVFTSGLRDGAVMMQHEFGHVLQYRKVGARAYYSIIAPESLVSAAMDGHMNHSHHSFWTETWANYLSKKYFDGKWLGRLYPITYPAKKISRFNWYRLMSVKNSSVRKP